MSDDFGTVNVRGGERAREIEVLRQHYRRHRDALHRMIADAPTESLAKEYGRIADEIDRSILKLDELEGRDMQAAAPRPQSPPPRPAAPAAMAAELPSPHGDPLRAASEPGMRTLHPTPGIDADDTIAYPPPDERTGGGGTRVLLILGAALVAVIVIGWLVWRASSDRGETPPLVDTAAPVATETVEPADTQSAPPAAAAASGGIEVAPASQDYGVIRKGTRAMRRFEVSNTTDEPITIELARSTCRCLYYAYDGLIPPKGKQAVTVTVDAAKATAGPLRESIRISSKKHPDVDGTLQLVAEVK